GNLTMISFVHDQRLRLHFRISIGFSALSQSGLFGNIVLVVLPGNHGKTAYINELFDCLRFGSSEAIARAFPVDLKNSPARPIRIDDTGGVPNNTGAVERRFD